MTHPRHGLLLVAALLFPTLAPSAARADSPVPAPKALSPVGDATVAGGDVHFAWSPSMPPDGRQLRYELEVWSGMPEGTDARPVANTTQSDGLDGVTLGGLPYGPLTWRVRAVSRGGVVSDWSATATFKTADMFVSKVGGVQGSAGGCAIGRRAARPGLLLLLVLGTLPLLYRRRWS